ncbi:transcriptional regulator of acetoin/glycerol metabolism [Pseudacidovorax sp. 1753]|uniref:helix-turn-helix domain-containing protein n=1 Tax=Pseudacidovorax sp. 1753 TaxID=3156419 RepID=UPI00339286A9
MVNQPLPTGDGSDLQHLVEATPDLVDRIFQYLVEEFPNLADDPVGLTRARIAVRAEFAGEEVYIPKRISREIATEVLRLFNGRNATEVARRLGISRRTVYRYLKQPGK